MLKSPKKLNIIMFSVTLKMLTNSCQINKYVVGEDSQTGAETKIKNSFFLLRLIDGKTSNPKMMTSVFKNYSVTIE